MTGSCEKLPEQNELAPVPENTANDLSFQPHKRALELWNRFLESQSLQDLEESIRCDREALCLRLEGHPARDLSMNNLGSSLTARYEILGHAEDLDESISLHRATLLLRSETHAEYSTSLNNIATSLLSRFERDGKVDDLEQSIKLHRAALAKRPIDHEFHYVSLNNLASAVWTRFKTERMKEDLNEAIVLYRAAVDLPPELHPCRQMSVDNLVNSLIERFRQNKGLKDIDEAIALQRRAVDASEESQARAAELKILAYLLSLRDGRLENASDMQEAITIYRSVLGLIPNDDPERYASLSGLATCLRDEWEQSNRIQDLEDSIEFFRQALALCAEQDTKCVSAQANLAYVLRVRFEQSGEMEDIEEVIDLYRTAQQSSSDDTERVALLHSLALALHLKFGRTLHIEDLEESIALCRGVLELRPDPDPERPGTLNNLGLSLWELFEQRGRIEDLEEAIHLHRTALSLRPVGDIDRPESLGNLAFSLRTLFEQCGRVEDLDEAIALHSEALDLVAEGSLRAGALNNLATVLSARSRIWQSVDDQNKAVELYREALALCPKKHMNYSTFLYNLASSLCGRYNQGGRMEDLEESIAHDRAALALRPAGHSSRAASLNNLANALSARYTEMGDMVDLEELISLHRETLSLSPRQNPNRPIALTNLGSSLLARFERIRRTDDLDESIEVHRECVALCAEGHHIRALALANLGNSLYLRFDFKKTTDDLEEAISMHHSALDLRVEGNPERSASLYSMALCLGARFQQLAQQDDLDESITFHRAALHLRPQEHPQRSASLDNLATFLLTRFETQGQEQDLSESIEMNRAALALRPEGNAEHSISLNNLASSLLARYQREDTKQDIEEIFVLMESGAEHPYSSVLTRVGIAIRWARLARTYSHSSTPRAYRTALSLMENSLAFSPTLQMQHDVLTNHLKSPALALDAASLFIERGELIEAVEVLEQGRTLLWSELRGFRTSLDHLEKSHEPLATKLRSINRQLENLATTSETQHFGLLTTAEIDVHRIHRRRSFDEMLVMRRHLAEQQVNVIEEIRKQPGFEDFLRPAPFKVLQDAAQEGPVIIVNHCKYRCDAVIVLSNHPPINVPLDSQFYADTTSICKELLQTRDKFNAVSHEYDAKLREVMKMLWDRVVSLVVQKLIDFGVGPGERIWWCPTSTLSAFPFHAAGPFENSDGTSQYLLDEYISSYTPTLKSLIAARSGKIKGRLKLLVIGDTQLPSAAQEVDIIRKYGMPAEFLIDDEASRSTVLDKLAESKWVHFACHGQLDSKPFDSSFKLSDAGLTLLDIARAELPNAEFAFLSACHTAEQPLDGGQDEVLHLAAAIQFCGFRSVIGTMWELFDVDGPAFAKHIYARLIEKPTKGEARFKRSAGALRAAALALKAQDGIAAEGWVNMVHIGA
ncbi:hypothetical protein PHLCEN_2v13716 [Hermanssonia centrifuga]|uniref:CHAT domain-containing protein n=1 Tax=Hermanssonia centrifuga TaxID=98765 RepID=A0A2R6NDL7_9APHY|nr:hypothetical protein PHLCEN_2v13716 [Hermanssonia centrifuga]